MNISLVIPCYNEEANIQKGVLDKIGNYTKDDPLFVEVLIVDDGSTDSSKKLSKVNIFPNFQNSLFLRMNIREKLRHLLPEFTKLRGIM